MAYRTKYIWKCDQVHCFIFPFVYMSESQFCTADTFSLLNHKVQELFTKHMLTDDKSKFLKFCFTYWKNIHIWTFALAGSNSVTWSHIRYLQNPSESSNFQKRPKVLNEQDKATNIPDYSELHSWTPHGQWGNKPNWHGNKSLVILT